MYSLKRTVLTLLAFYALLGIICVFTGIHEISNSLILPPFEFSSFWSAWLIVFVKSFPATTFVAILFSYTQSFATVTRTNKVPVNYSNFFVNVIKQVCLIALVFCAINFIFREVLYPKAEFSKISNISHSEQYRHYNATMESARISGNDDLTLDLLNRMLVISDYDERLLALHEKLTARIKIKNSTLTPPVRPNDSAPKFHNSLTFKDALYNAENAMNNEDWFSMHYYATLAIKLADNANPDKNRALKMAAEAWNTITEQQTDMQTREAYDLYAEKMRGHGALQSEDYLKAYYIFLSLQAKLPNDPDIEKYLSISRNELQNFYFFIEEMTDLIFQGKSDNFKSGFCDFFLLKTKDQGTQVIFFDKIAHKKNSKTDLLYINNLEIMCFSPYGTLTYHLRAPYAKLIPCNTSATQIEDWQTIAIMKAVHSVRSDIAIAPEVISGELPFKNAEIVIMDISMKELLLLLGKENSINKTPLSVLVNLYTKIDRYGFSKVSILSELIFRISLPLLYMFFTFAAVWCSWKFRIKNNGRFKKRYFCFVPVFYIILFLFTNFFEYEYRCLIFTVLPVLGIYTAVIILILIVLLLTAVVLSLSCQRDTEAV